MQFFWSQLAILVKVDLIKLFLELSLVLVLDTSQLYSLHSGVWVRESLTNGGASVCDWLLV